SVPKYNGSKCDVPECNGPKCCGSECDCPKCSGRFTFEESFNGEQNGAKTEGRDDIA
ncbi:1019_t:CDS:1, partial [Gigaspora margarita]